MICRAVGRHPDRIALGVLLLLGTVLRLALVTRAPVFITNDSHSYLLPGYDLALGYGFEPIYKRPPGYPVFVGWSIWFFGRDSLTGLLLAQHLLGLAAVVLTYLLGLRLHGRMTAILGGLLTAVSGPLLVTEHYLMSETLFGVLLLASVLTFVLGSAGRDLRWIAACGVLVALAALTRPVAQILVPMLALCCLPCWATWRARLLAVSVLLACFTLSVLPWMLRNSSVQGSFTLAGGMGEGLAVRTIRYGQQFDFRYSESQPDPLATERRIYREEARQESVYELAQRLRTEAGLSPAQADRAMGEIARTAIRQKVTYYLVGSVDMFQQMFAGRPIRLRQDWRPWRGISWEERVQHLLPPDAPPDERDLQAVQTLVGLYDPARAPLLLATLFAIGCVASFRAARPPLALLPPLVTVALLLASAFLVGIEWRYRFPLDPLIHVTVGSAVAMLWMPVRRGFRPLSAIRPRPAA